MAYVAPKPAAPSSCFCKLQSGPTTAAQTSTSFFAASRTATNSQHTYGDGTSLNTLTTVESTPAVSDSKFTTGARGNSASNGADLFAAVQDRFAFISTSLTNADVTAFTTLIVNYQTNVITGGRVF